MRCTINTKFAIDCLLGLCAFLVGCDSSVKIEPDPAPAPAPAAEKSVISAAPLKKLESLVSYTANDRDFDNFWGPDKDVGDEFIVSFEATSNMKLKPRAVEYVHEQLTPRFKQYAYEHYLQVAGAPPSVKGQRVMACSQAFVETYGHQLALRLIELNNE